MDLILSSNDHQQMLDWAVKAGERECCGILRGTGRHVRAVELAKNVAPDPARHFEIDPATLVAAHKSARAGGLPLLGYFHSHPNGLAAPSPTDVAQAAPDGLIWLIIASHSISAWRPTVCGARVSGFTSVSVVVEG